ncbi:uncharacterized protein LY89DRAFT_685093 [Mollisia scopiformis]|uniref:Uncharacterized protein n=1 Tax=Mollisia scopiformis TaxID=149040 RepID=A0A194XAI5_MOLSC|nr:uncharacterized protein LY89DRAFT_685093 [Mollisia scopiformis]KUJ17154.1 hypothetical protein LY89DRAFT_685093 [Mollisia scopiformis]
MTTSMFSSKLSGLWSKKQVIDLATLDFYLFQKYHRRHLINVQTSDGYRCEYSTTQDRLLTLANIMIFFLTYCGIDLFPLQDSIDLSVQV